MKATTVRERWGGGGGQRGAPPATRKVCLQLIASDLFLTLLEGQNSATRHQLRRGPRLKSSLYAAIGVDRPVLQAGVVPLVMDDPGAVRWPGPAVGAHTEEVLAEVGRSRADVEALRGRGVL